MQIGSDLVKTSEGQPFGLHSLNPYNNLKCKLIILFKKLYYDIYALISSQKNNTLPNKMLPKLL